jgi:hypothetical protein
MRRHYDNCGVYHLIGNAVNEEWVKGYQYLGQSAAQHVYI